MFTASLVHEAVGYKEMGNYDRKYSILTYMTLGMHYYTSCMHTILECQ